MATSVSHIPKQTVVGIIFIIKTPGIKIDLKLFARVCLHVTILS